MPDLNDDCPECRQGECSNCTHVALNEEADEFVDCECERGGHL
jgi:hypothetical protein